METSVVTMKGQVVIPKKIRNIFHIKKGTHIHFEAGDGAIVLRPLTPDYFEKMAGVAGTGGKILKAFVEDKKKERDL
ncbi:MAG: AbrB/MazE/SpoVT family DNA-binding domain-containing protein [Candidatus Omnitrophica bacterium]|nr:AbrB/MazE/SpoVT family DNA-binding domain-containing protein [Candidatus Omnitrophota bacterium]